MKVRGRTLADHVLLIDTIINIFSLRPASARAYQDFFTSFRYIQIFTFWDVSWAILGSLHLYESFSIFITARKVLLRNI